MEDAPEILDASGDDPRVSYLLCNLHSRLMEEPWHVHNTFLDLVAPVTAEGRMVPGNYGTINYESPERAHAARGYLAQLFIGIHTAGATTVAIPSYVARTDIDIRLSADFLIVGIAYVLSIRSNFSSAYHNCITIVRIYTRTDKSAS